MRSFSFHHHTPDRMFALQFSLYFNDDRISGAHSSHIDIYDIKRAATDCLLQFKYEMIFIEYFSFKFLFQNRYSLSSYELDSIIVQIKLT